MLIYGAANKNKEIDQTMNVSGHNGDIFTISGSAEGETVPISVGRAFSLSLGLKYTTDNRYHWTDIQFKPDVPGWQYASDAVQADEDYSSVIYRITYFGNENQAYFTGLHLYKYGARTGFTYNPSGHLTKTSNLGAQSTSTSNEYYANNDLKSITDAKNNTENYNYDNNHNLLTSTSAENVVQNFVYDSYGNQIKATTGDPNSLFIQSSNNYTASGNYIKYQTDSIGNTITNNWDENKGVLNSTIDAKGNAVNYSYDNMNNLTGVSSTIGANNIETFSLNNSAIGSNGTKTVDENAVYETDASGKSYLASYEVASNMLTTNSSFESGLTSWTLADWNSSTGKARAVSDGLNGSQSLELYDSDGLVNGSTTNDVAYQYLTLASPLTAATSYTISAYAKRTGDTQPQIGIDCYDSNNKEISGGYLKYTQNININQWTRVSQTFTVPTGTKKLMIIVRANVKDKDLVRFDAVQVEQKTFSTPYTSTTRAATRVLYNLGVNSNSGTMSVWFDTKGSGSRQVLSNEGTNSQILNAYIDNSNIYKLALRKNDNTWVDLISASDTPIANNQWYFTAIRWQIKNSVLYCTLYLNGKSYSASIADYKDFTGGKTGVGNSLNGLYQVDGDVEQFNYTPKALSDTDINSLYQKTLVNSNGTNITDSYSYLNDNISTITHNGFNYNFGYDSLGNNTSISVGNQNLIQNTYETINVNGSDHNTGRLQSSTFGNGQIIKNDYDNLGRIVAKEYNGTVRYTYQYDSNGNVGYSEDKVNGVNYKYYYDASERLNKIEDTSGNQQSYSYDANGNSSSISEMLNGVTFNTSYGYNKDNQINSMQYSRFSLPSNQVNYNHDSLGRIYGQTLNTGAYSYNTAINYLSGANGSSTNLVESITNDSNSSNKSTISYTYDENNNISTITQDGKKIKYYYNELNELVREDNAILNETIVYNYDLGGNITSKVEYSYTDGGTPTTQIKSHSYAYNNSNWKDEMTSFDGNAITYDNTGNPLSYNGYTYSWEEGRQLSSVSGNGSNISYKYNDCGIRTQKTVNGVTTNYHLDGDKVTYENNGTDKIYYTYDSAGNLLSMNLNGTEYYYIKNAQGDIIGLYDNSGTQVVAYTYDSWGKLISISGSLKDTVGVKNPYRYRSYRYDTETSMYYLQSRYYSPEWGRFINADDTGILQAQQGVLLSSNLFAYCSNNPESSIDLNGNSLLSYLSSRKIIGGAINLLIFTLIGCGSGKLAQWFARESEELGGKAALHILEAAVFEAMIKYSGKAWFASKIFTLLGTTASVLSFFADPGGWVFDHLFDAYDKHPHDGYWEV